jgi:phosphatidylserine/phosphatidylglycerophosphate/cardiolipin synthase-like enzyme
VIKWEIPVLAEVLGSLEFSGKASVPWGKAELRNVIHAKVAVVDDTVFLGSFNLSRSREENAENMVEIEDARVAEQLASFIDGICDKYPASSVPESAVERKR